MAHPPSSIEIVNGAVLATLRCPEYTEREEAFLSQQVTEAASRHGWKIALDVSDFNSPGSAGLGAVVRVDIRCRREGGRLVLFGATPAGRELLAITRLDRYFSVEPDRESALRTLGQA